MPTPQGRLQDVPLLDLALLQGLARNLPAQTLQGLLGRSLDGARDSWRRLEAALDSPDRLAGEAHRLRGTAGTFGLARVSALAGVIEERVAHAEEVGDLVVELGMVVDATCAAVSALEQ